MRIRGQMGHREPRVSEVETDLSCPPRTRGEKKGGGDRSQSFQTLRVSGLCQGGFPHRPGWENLCVRGESQPGYLSSIRDGQSPQRTRHYLYGICWKLTGESTPKKDVTLCPPLSFFLSQILSVDMRRYKIP